MDKGKGRAKVCPELPFELWDAIFAHYYDDWAANWERSGVSTGALLPLLISPDFYDRALEALYLHPMLSGTNILPFLVAIGSSSWSARAKRCFVRSLTVCTTAGMWRPLGRGDAAPPIEAPMHALLRLLPAPASLRIVDSGGMAAGPEDAFAALAQTSPRKARLEWALWDWAAPGDAALSGALGQGAHALVYAHAARTSHHTPSVLAASATPSTRLPHDALAWLRVLEDGGTYDVPRLWLETDPATANDTYSSPSDAHQIRQRVATLVQGWCPRLHALSLVTHDPLASLIVRAPDLDLWTHMPVPHIRVRLACATDPLTVMMGAKDVARDRERRARRAAGEIDPDDDDRVLGGDGNGYGLLHPNTRLFEIEVNTHAEMRAGADNWLRAGGQLPAAVCRIIAGEHDWGLVGTTRSRTFDDPVEVAPSSPATSAFPSPTFSFEVLSGDDEDVLMNENQGGSADGGGHMITA
ncbi:hypothetical protein Q5752_000163 [Cryptotrichosporon argae]